MLDFDDDDDDDFLRGDEEEEEEEDEVFLLLREDLLLRDDDEEEEDGSFDFDEEEDDEERVVEELFDGEEIFDSCSPDLAVFLLDVLIFLLLHLWVLSLSMLLFSSIFNDNSALFLSL